MGGNGSQIGQAEAASALRWWLESGVDTIVRDEPADWLGKAAAEPAAIAAIPAAPRQPASSDVLNQSVSVPLEMPETLDLFRDWLAKSSDLPLAAKSSRRVLPRGAEHAPIMLIADIPANEDAKDGSPISGEAWELTVRMLAAIGIDAQDAYCANISCLHAPGARMSRDELDSCAAIARRHVAMVKPKLLLLLGDGPARALLGKDVVEARGHPHQIEGVRTVATFHPRFLLNQPSSKSLAWRDLLLLMEDRP